MTYEDMNEQLMAFCDCRKYDLGEDKCIGCPINLGEGICFVNSGEIAEPDKEDIKRNYHIVFSDNVDHPNHYAGKYECIDVMESLYGTEAVKDFCLLNAFKYIWRTQKKNGLEDIKKATWYLKKYVKLSEGDESNDIS